MIRVMSVSGVVYQIRENISCNLIGILFYNDWCNKKKNCYRTIFAVIFRTNRSRKKKRAFPVSKETNLLLLKRFLSVIIELFHWIGTRILLVFYGIARIMVYCLRFIVYYNVIELIFWYCYILIQFRTIRRKFNLSIIFCYITYVICPN